VSFGHGYPADRITEACERFETPFFIYETDRIRENARALIAAFEPRFESFRPLFAVKANPNPAILEIVLDEGLELDCSSAMEVWLARRLGAGGMFTGNFVSPRSWSFILERDDLLLNLDDLSALDAVSRVRTPEFLSFRVNPEMTGAALETNQLGGREAKFGVPLGRVMEAYESAARAGVRRFGMHAMSGSNVFRVDYFTEVTRRLLELVVEVRDQLGLEIECVNVGGGFPVAYHPDDPVVSLDEIAGAVRSAFDEVSSELNPTLLVEPGRRVSADAGWLVTTVTSIKRAHKTFVGVDASTADLPRPFLYGAHHQISVLERSGDQPSETVDVVGSVCETTDRLATDRDLPRLAVGDVLVIHNCGAHAFAMSHNYNGRLRCAEYLLDDNASPRLIRRAERFEDLVRTVPGWSAGETVGR
jgi:diaminopimelate decarboxylase